jgi:hypothetical protein
VEGARGDACYLNRKDFLNAICSGEKLHKCQSEEPTLWLDAMNHTLINCWRWRFVSLTWSNGAALYLVDPLSHECLNKLLISEMHINIGKEI